MIDTNENKVKCITQLKPVFYLKNCNNISETILTHNLFKSDVKKF